MLTWLIKTKQYFTTKVFTEDRFRTNDKPTESEYSNLFQSIIFKVHDLATVMLAGIVRKATLLHFLRREDDAPTNLSGYTHKEPLYVSPSLLDEFVESAGTIFDWIPFRKKRTGERFTDTAGTTITDTEFVTLVGTSTVSAVNFYDPNVINYFEREYLSSRYRICDGRVITFVNPYTNLTETVQLPDLRERVTRGAGSNNTIPNNLLFNTGGVDFQNLSHYHVIDDIELSNKIIPNPISIQIPGISNLPLHDHLYDRTVATTITFSYVQSLTGISPPAHIISSQTVVNSATNVLQNTTPTGQTPPDPFTVNPTITFNDVNTNIETPLDTPNFTNFSNVDNRQKYFNVYKIIALY